MDGIRFDDFTQRLTQARSRRQVLKLVGASVLASGGFAGWKQADAAEKVLICHHRTPNSSPNIMHVSQGALKSHLAHGDSVFGNCCVDSECGALNDPCNVGVCDRTTGYCAPAPANEGAACNDGSLCTTGDVCAAGACVGIPVDCTEFDDACTVGTCDASTGSCFALPVNEGGACDDGNACTSPDPCTAGVCSGPEVSCNDGNECTQNLCDPVTGCSNPPVANWTRCTGGVCQQGVCAPVCLDDYYFCSSNEECCGGRCVDDVPFFDVRCCGRSGAKCDFLGIDIDGVCCSGDCQGSRCT